MIVVDSCAVVDLVFGSAEIAGRIAERMARADGLAAPHLIDVEVLGACRSLEQRRLVSPTEARAAVAGLRELRLSRYPHLPLRDRMWDLRHRVSAPDAAYVALAEALDVPLLTTDRRLSRAHGLDCEIVAP